MPREKKHRGRREEKKKQKQEGAQYQENANLETEYPPAKRRKPTEEDYIPFEGSLNQPLKDPLEESLEDAPPQDAPRSYPSFNAPPAESQFFGLLDEEEQAYFKRADDMLVANTFPNAQERDLSVESVWREASGKELKIACSQGCSRVMERLIEVSIKAQLRMLFEKFEGHFLHLVQHRFASHCVEALFLRSATLVGGEGKIKKEWKESTGGRYSMEILFINVLNELEGNIGYLLTERFASHTLRLLFLILAGEPLDQPALASKNKDKIEHLTARTRAMTSKTRTNSDSTTQRSVPPSFREALDKMIKESVAPLDTTYLRALATHPTGNPPLQLLLSIEMKRNYKDEGSERSSILTKLIPDRNIDEGTSSHSFLKGLLYDLVGSHLLEGIVVHAPGRVFKSIYKGLFEENFGTIAKNDVASFVAIQVLERLSRKDLQSAMSSTLLEMPTLINRSKFSLLKTIIKRCEVRGLDTKPIEEALQQIGAYGNDPKQMIISMLQLDSYDAPETSDSFVKQRHGAQLARAMIQSSGGLSKLIYDGLFALTLTDTVMLSKGTHTSRLIQEALTTSSSTVQFRRKYLPRFHGHLVDLALDARGSHTVDALWNGTQDLFFLKERFAEELGGAESEMRESHIGRLVWRNWEMDLWKTRRVEWIGIARAKDQGKEEATNGNEQDTSDVRRKPVSKIDQARARFANQAAMKQGRYQGGRENAIATRAGWG
jgi:nucleolar protein 9